MAMLVYCKVDKKAHRNEAMGKIMLNGWPSAFLTPR